MMFILAVIVFHEKGSDLIQEYASISKILYNMSTYGF